MTKRRTFVWQRPCKQTEETNFIPICAADAYITLSFMYTCSARRLLSSHATLRPAFTSRKISLSASVAKTLTPGHRQILSHQGTIRFASDTSTQQGSGHRTPLTTATEVSEKSVTPEESLLQGVQTDGVARDFVNGTETTTGMCYSSPLTQ